MKNTHISNDPQLFIELMNDKRNVAFFNSLSCSTVNQVWGVELKDWYTYGEEMKEHVANEITNYYGVYANGEDVGYVVELNNELNIFRVQLVMKAIKDNAIIATGDIDEDYGNAWQYYYNNPTSTVYTQVDGQLSGCQLCNQYYDWEDPATGYIIHTEGELFTVNDMNDKVGRIVDGRFEVVKPYDAVDGEAYVHLVDEQIDSNGMKHHLYIMEEW